MNKCTTLIRDSLMKSYDFNNLVDKETLIKDLGYHSYIYEEFLRNHLNETIYSFF